MDIAITGLKIEDRYTMVEELQKLALVLSQWDCLDSFKAIETASMPVIKLVNSTTCLILYRK